MDMPTDTDETVTAESRPIVRSVRGTFLPGTRPGPGNPNVRKLNSLRRAFIDAVTVDDIGDIVRKHTDQAKDGDQQSAAIVLSYVFGKPKDTPLCDDAAEGAALRERMIQAAWEAMERVRSGAECSAGLKSPESK